jgi:hypothetical protein
MGAVLPYVKNPLVFGPEAMIADLYPRLANARQERRALAPRQASAVRHNAFREWVLVI